MNDSYKYFFLNNNCILEKGKVNGVIVNFENGCSYHLDKEAVEILSLSEKGYSVNEIAKILKISSTKLFSFLNKIKEFGLGDFYQNKVFIDNFKYFTMDYIFLEKLHGKIKLKTLIIEINNNCFLNCINCNRANSAYSFCGCSKWNYDKKIEIDSFKKAIKEAAKFNLESIYFVGGDPLLSGETLKELIKYSLSNGVKKFSLLSNLYVLEQSLILFFLSLMWKYSPHYIFTNGSIMSLLLGQRRVLVKL